jgi:hypothetical protein
MSATTVTETLELKLTPAQIRAAYERAHRRKKNVGGCAHYDLGDISSEDGSESSNVCTAASARESS